MDLKKIVMFGVGTVISIAFLIGCGSSNNSKNSEVYSLDSIAAFVERRRNHVPTVQDYNSAGFDRVNSLNINQINAIVIGVKPSTPLVGKQTEDFIKEEINNYLDKQAINDTTAPSITLVGANTMSLTVGDDFKEPGVKTLDYVDGKIEVTSSGIVDTSKSGVYTITYTVVDKSGNRATTTRTVIVKDKAPTDTLPPSISLVGQTNETLTIDDKYIEKGASAVDAVDGKTEVVISGNVDTTKAGNYSIIYTSTDKAGNTSSVTRTVTVQVKPSTDNIAPVISLNGATSMSSTVGQTFVDPGATATDVVDGNINVTTKGSVDVNIPDVYTISYTATDTSGNTATATRTITIVAPSAEDKTAPEITINGSATQSVDLGTEYVDEGAKAIDAVDGDISIEKNGTVDTATAGKYTITYTATDAANNTATATREVTVIDPAPKDTTSPVIKLNGETAITIAVDSTYSELGATASDNIDGDISTNISMTGSVDSSKSGTYMIRYSVTDEAGNRTSTTRTITVQNLSDTTAPSIMLNGGDTEIIINNPYTELGVIATDDVDGNVSVSISGDVDTNTTGTYIITYTAIDKAGNKSTTERNVIVKAAPPVDTEAPIISLNGESTVTLTIGTNYIDAGVSIEDIETDISANLVTNGLPIDTSVAGTHTITYNVSDTVGNIALEVIRTVVVNPVVSTYTMAEVTALLEAAANGSNTNVKYVTIHDSNRDGNVIGMLDYYRNQLNKINVKFVEEVMTGNESKRFVNNASTTAGDSTLASLNANKNISADGSNTIIEFGLGRNDRALATTYGELKSNIKTAIEAVQNAKPNAMIFLVTPKEHPVDDTAQNASGKNDLRKAYSEIASELSLPLLDMKAVAAQSIVAPDSSDYYPKQNGEKRTDYYYTDTIHLNESGGRRVVNYIFSKIGGQTVFKNMLLEEFSDSGDSYEHKTVADINKGLAVMNLHLASQAEGKSLWFTFKDSNNSPDKIKTLDSKRVNFIRTKKGDENGSVVPSYLTSLDYTDGTLSGVSIDVTSTFSGTNSAVYEAKADDIVPFEMLKAKRWFVGPALGMSTKGTIMFKGLIASKEYKFELGAIRPDLGENTPKSRLGKYTVNGTIKQFDADRANNRSLVFDTVTADANGNIQLDVEVVDPAARKYAYLSWIKLTEK